ncbi:hypothetical protein LZ32DRAFT_662850 [Colletotrichum eremochloae]|nr:hypothetical protein LZ32DRAFT_662850 [Colletotrichum eremochloae]
MDHAVPAHPRRSDPFTRVDFSFVWGPVGGWPGWATLKPEPLESKSANPGAVAASEETTPDGLERYSRTLVCSKCAHPWCEDLETFELAKGLVLLQDNKANPHDPVPVSIHGIWILLEFMFAPRLMTQIVKAAGRVLTLDFASKEKLINELVADDAIPEKEEEEGSESQYGDTKSERGFEGDEHRGGI